MPLLKLFRRAELSFNDGVSSSVRSTAPSSALHKELCYYVESSDELDELQLATLHWLLRGSSDESSALSTDSTLTPGPDDFVFEVGPRLNVSTPSSTNCVSVCETAGLTAVSRVEISRRYHVISQQPISEQDQAQIISTAYDRMTECCYSSPLQSFGATVAPEPWTTVPVLTYGRSALEHINQTLGLAFDDWDLDFYLDLFRNKLQRDPTSVECFDLAQSNSEHSRHWFFKGRLVIDGTVIPESLLDLVVGTQQHTAPNNVIKFSDNSSAIVGGSLTALVASSAEEPAPLRAAHTQRHLVFTAETHNFPTGVAPFSGATTGTGGRIRDVQAVGRGGHVIAGTAGYCVGNLMLPGHTQPWEDVGQPYPTRFASARRVLLEASDGASDYGNKFGEPLVAGFCRSFGQTTPTGRREWIKPIMFSGGIGTMPVDMVHKLPPQKGMLVVKLGGPAYRIGVGGGAASSVKVQGVGSGELDFGAVQRGDAEMEQKLNRVIRACLECGSENPICSIHDQGAGGNGNVLKEIVEPAGAVFYTEDFQKGDLSLSALELWGAEYQESNAIICRADSRDRLTRMCRREKCPVSFVGEVTGDGKVVLREGTSGTQQKTQDPVDLELVHVLGKMPAKEFRDSSLETVLLPLELPDIGGSKDALTSGGSPCSTELFRDALKKILRLPSVGSKRYLTNKVDRSVTGLVAQQQCVGPLHTPLADAAVIAVSHYDTWGAATSIGEQPIKSLLSPAAGARLSVAEAITNLAFVPITRLEDVKCSANWMWPAKLPGEAAAIYTACRAMCDVMSKMGVAVDGGKDSLSMAARVSTDTVKAPGSLVVSTYVRCPDIRRCVGPDLRSADSQLLHVRFSAGAGRLGGSALAQCFSQLGDVVPDLDQPETLAAAFRVTQRLVRDGLLLSGHDVSDGGALVSVLEMSIAGVRGVDLLWPLDVSNNIFRTLMAEEPGWILEVNPADQQRVIMEYRDVGATCISIGFVTERPHIRLRVEHQTLLDMTLEEAARMWEETSYHLELLQVETSCAESEWSLVGRRRGPVYTLPAGYRAPEVPQIPCRPRPLVAVVREEGTNGDREMAAAFDLAGFEVWDVTMTDLSAGHTTLDRFRGLVFPGGFSYADVCGSGVGWAASIRSNATLSGQFERYRRRSNTFSLGVCNGCQLMALLGWIPGSSSDDDDGRSGEAEVRLAGNTSGRFESRFSTVRVTDCGSPLLQGMTGAVLGVWVAHGEGRFTYSRPHTASSLLRTRQVALQYVDDAGDPTEVYPYNPNGSELGVAGLCSSDGRHLAMMPHPERCVRPWQWPYKPDEWKLQPFAPWFSVFRNAYEWTVRTQ